MSVCYLYWSFGDVQILQQVQEVKHTWMFNKSVGKIIYLGNLFFFVFPIDVVIPSSWEQTCRFLYDNLSLYNGSDGQFINRCRLFLVNVFSNGNSRQFCFLFSPVVK